MFNPSANDRDRSQNPRSEAALGAPHVPNMVVPAPTHYLSPFGDPIPVSQPYAPAHVSPFSAPPSLMPQAHYGGGAAAAGVMMPAVVQQRPDFTAVSMPSRFPSQGPSQEGSEQPSDAQVHGWLNELIKFSNGAIQIGALTTATVAHLGTPTIPMYATGLVFAVLFGGRLSLYIVETAADVIEKVHKIEVPPEGTYKRQISHLEDVAGFVNLVVKGFIQSAALVNVTVAYYLSKSNWVAQKVAAPILTGCTAAEFFILTEELVMSGINAAVKDFTPPKSIETVNSLVRGVVQIIALSSITASRWAGSSQIPRMTAYVQVGLVGGRTLTLMLEVAALLLAEYRKYQQRQQQEEDSIDAYELPVGAV